MNDRADAEAKSVLQDFVGRSNAYSLLVDAYKARECDAKSWRPCTRPSHFVQLQSPLVPLL